MSFVNYSLTDKNNDGDVDRFDNDSINGSDVTASYSGDTVTIHVSGVGNVTYSGITLYPANGQRVFTPTDGQALQNGTMVSTTWVSGQGPLGVTTLGPVCFTPGTLIETVRGPRQIETLVAGDLVETLDNGPQPLLSLHRETFAAEGAAAPVMIGKGALGNNADLLVSQQHRMLIGDWRARLYFGASEVLVAAKHLVNGDTIYLRKGGEVDYIHLLFAEHEIVTAAGIPSESYFPEFAQFRAGIRGADRASGPADSASGGQTARKVLKRVEGQLLA